MKKLSFLALVILALVRCNPQTSQSTNPEIAIHNTVLNEVNDMIFGHFMEKCSWGGEIGGDLVINPNTGEFDTIVLKHLKSMNIPVIRYPGGTDIDYYNWTDLIDNAPWQTKRKPYKNHRAIANNGEKDTIVSDNRLGLHEFFALCKELECEPLYVMNLGDVFFKKISIQESKERAAGFYAYCNMTSVESGSNWPEYRKMNGHEAPFNLKYFQIGNESWGYDGFDWAYTDRDPELVQHLYNCITAIADTLRALSSDIKIIADGPFQQTIDLLVENNYDKIDYVVFHSYQPWNVGIVRTASGDTVSADSLTTKDTWNAWVSTPNIDTVTGFSITQNDAAAKATIGSSFDVAVTEWNWNGWYADQYSAAKLEQPDLAKGIGAAGFLHGFMRDGEKVKIACQSMTVGKSWGITGIRIDPTYQQDAVMFPSGQVTGLYASHHGNALLQTEYANIPSFTQPYKMNAIQPRDKVAALDILTTKSDTHLFVHVINRSFDEDYTVDINLFDLSVEKDFVVYVLEGDNVDRISNKNLKQITNIEEKKYSNAGKTFSVNIAHSTVSVYVFELN